MLGFLTLLLACQLAGEFLVLATGLPLPGPVVGMVLLFVGLFVRGGVPAGLQTVAGELLRHLSLLFVPAGVGVMLHLTLIAEEWAAISVALVASTVITVGVTAGTMVVLSRLTGSRDENSGET
jgi:holin-like protein